MMDWWNSVTGTAPEDDPVQKALSLLGQGAQAVSSGLSSAGSALGATLQSVVPDPLGGAAGTPPDRAFPDPEASRNERPPYDSGGYTNPNLTYPVAEPDQTPPLDTPGPAPTFPQLGVPQGTMMRMPLGPPTTGDTGAGPSDAQAPEPPPSDSPLKPLYDLRGQVVGYVHSGMEAAKDLAGRAVSDIANIPSTMSNPQAQQNLIQSGQSALEAGAEPAHEAVRGPDRPADQ